MMNVLLLGHCGFDGPKIGAKVSNSFQAKILTAATATDATKVLASHKIDIILVNRIFDADGDSGIEWIKNFKKEESAIPALLISNYADAQTQAVAVGGAVGFGKSELSSNLPIERIRAALHLVDK